MDYFPKLRWKKNISNHHLEIQEHDNLGAHGIFFQKSGLDSKDSKIQGYEQLRVVEIPQTHDEQKWCNW